METKRFNRKSIALLFAIAVFFCGFQSLSFGQVELIISDPASLTEATLHNSTVTLTLRGGEFDDDIERTWSRPLKVSGISGVSVDDVKLLSDTQIRVRLEFSGDFDRDDTLTFTVSSSGIKNYNGSNLTDTIPVTSTVESLTATTPVPLTEATLHNSTVTLTLSGRTFEDNVERYVSVSGISGVSVGEVKSLSDTQISVRLEFNGDLDREATLTFEVDSRGIKNYNDSDLTDEVRVTTATESLTATSTPSPLTEATLHNSTVTLTLRGRTFENNIRSHVSVSGISGVSVGNVRLLSNTEVEVTLQFNGDFNRDGTLTFRVRNGGIKNYNGSEFTAQIPVTAIVEPRLAFDIKNPNTKFTIGYQIRWSNNDSWRNHSLEPGYGTLHQSHRTLPSGYPKIRFHDIGGIRSYTLETAEYRENSDDIPIYHFVYNQQDNRLDLRRTTPQPNVAPTPQPNVAPTPQPNVAPTPQPTAVSIPDPNLRGAIQNEIGDTITTDAMLNLETLYAYDSGITNLTGLEHAENLSELELDSNSISDISALRGLTQLKSLVLGYNNISDISALAGLTQLTVLDLNDNNISDISALAGLTQLKTLSLRGNNISDVSPLAGLTHLESLLLDDNNISDTSPLDRLTRLTELDLTGNPLNAAVLKKPEVNTRTPTVPIDPSQPAIYWTTDSGIQRANLDGSNIQTLVKEVLASDITLDTTGGKMYWRTYHEGIVQRANLDGSNVQTLVRVGGVPEFTLDVAGGKIYWIVRKSRPESFLSSKILRANLDGSNVETLWERKPHAKGLTLDVSGGKMYWIDTDTEDDEVWGWGLTRSKILRANLDGSNIETLRATEGWEYIKTLALDVPGGKMYWFTDSDEAIRRANLDGSNVQTFVQHGYTRDITLDVAGGKMYWIGEDGGPLNLKLWRANLDGSNIENIIATPIGFFTLIPSQTPADDASPVAVRKTTQIHVDAADRPPMYWIDTAAGTLHRLVGAKVENLVPSVRNATSLTLDVDNAKLYWTEKTSHNRGRIRSANIDGANVRLVKDLTSVPFDITFNPADDQLYLTNGWGKVQGLNVDGSGFQSNLITGLDTPMNIVVDVDKAKLYWTEETSHSAGRIRSANIDGSNVQLVKNLASIPVDMALDAADGKLYLTNTSGQVQGLNVDGSGHQPNFITGLDTQMHIAVDTAGQKLYLTSSDGKISRQDFSGGGPEDVVTGLGSLGGLVLGVRSTATQMATTPATPAKYDINGDGTVNDEDARLLTEAISKGLTDAKYDVNGDGKVNFDDLQLVLDNRDRNPYDLNGDGTVDDTDARLLTEAISNGSTDTKYDLNDDGKVNFNDLQLVLDNRDAGAAGAPRILGNLKLTAAQIDRLQEQIDLLIATGDRSPAAMRTLIYLQQLIAMARPEKTQLLANYPNPFNPETWLPYELSIDSDVRITLYNVRGQVVRRLALGYQSAGYYTSRSRAAYWDGRNNVGEPVASGVYFYTLTAGDFTATRKMLIRK